MESALLASLGHLKVGKPVFLIELGILMENVFVVFFVSRIRILRVVGRFRTMKSCVSKTTVGINEEIVMLSFSSVKSDLLESLGLLEVEKPRDKLEVLREISYVEFFVTKISTFIVAGSTKF